MDPTIHRGTLPTAETYRRFAQQEARGVSAIYENWGNSVAEDQAVLDRLDSLPGPKRQPNLVFAAARLHGAGSAYATFRSLILGQWGDLRQTILSHSTQTNEAARCAVLLPFLATLPQPLALLEVGASAGLCLLPERYSYRYSGGLKLDPKDGPSSVVIECELGQGIHPPTTMPHVVWRAGIDLNPINVGEDGERTWLETLVWPEHEERRERLKRALAIAQREPPRVVRGNLVEKLPTLAAQAPSDATLVVFHSAVLAYLDSEERSRFVELVTGLPGHWISNEGPKVLEHVRAPFLQPKDKNYFVLTLDGSPQALTDPHGRSIRALEEE